MIKCPKCNDVHPDYFLKCPRCGLDKNSKQMGSNKSTYRHTNHQDSTSHYKDLSVDKFLAPQLMKLMLWMAILAGGLFTAAVSVIVNSIPQFSGFIKAFFIGTTVIHYVFAIAFFRIGYELVLVLFRIERNTSKN